MARVMALHASWSISMNAAEAIKEKHWIYRARWRFIDSSSTKWTTVFSQYGRNGV